MLGEKYSVEMGVGIMQQEQKLLRDANLKVTPQRTAILSFLRESKEHPGVEKVHRAILERYPSVSLATIYKTLELFREKGLIQEVSVSARKTGYDGNICFHPHLVCKSCHKIEDMPDPSTKLPEDYVREATEKYGYEINNEQLYLYGLCPECR
jgi:Fur family transcriptional regulator, peroxide stress response regulator